LKLSVDLATPAISADTVVAAVAAMIKRIDFAK
jgi:hypothetical protein